MEGESTPGRHGPRGDARRGNHPLNRKCPPSVSFLQYRSFEVRTACPTSAPHSVFFGPPPEAKQATVDLSQMQTVSGEERDPMLITLTTRTCSLYPKAWSPHRAASCRRHLGLLTTSQRSRSELSAQCRIPLNTSSFRTSMFVRTVPLHIDARLGSSFETIGAMSARRRVRLCSEH